MSVRNASSRFFGALSNRRILSDSLGNLRRVWMDLWVAEYEKHVSHNLSKYYYKYNLFKCYLVNEYNEHKY